jgi:hypothetical protein
MITRIVLGAVAVAAPLLLSAGAYAKCVVPFRFAITSPGPWMAVGTIKSGTTCPGSFNSSGPMVFKRLYLAAAPQHGSVRLQEGGRYSYSAKPGYVGQDRFTLRVCGSDGGVDGCADIQYNMTME